MVVVVVDTTFVKLKKYKYIMLIHSYVLTRLNF